MIRKSTTNKSQSVHYWLRRFYWHPTSCDFCGKQGCFQNNKWTICWSLKKGCEYEKKRENFIALCQKCHIAYDMNEMWRKNISKSRRNGRPYNRCMNGHILNKENLYFWKKGNFTRRNCRVCQRERKHKLKLLK